MQNPSQNTSQTFLKCKKYSFQYNPTMSVSKKISSLKMPSKHDISQEYIIRILKCIKSIWILITWIKVTLYALCVARFWLILCQGFKEQPWTAIFGLIELLCQLNINYLVSEISDNDINPILDFTPYRILHFEVFQSNIFTYLIILSMLWLIKWWCAWLR